MKLLLRSVPDVVFCLQHSCLSQFDIQNLDLKQTKKQGSRLSFSGKQIRVRPDLNNSFSIPKIESRVEPVFGKK
jgi:hypothetical protein